MHGFDFDLFVVGGGSGGVRASRIAASHGARVGIAEAYRLGGTCVIRGCVPKKLMMYASQFRGAFEDARGYGWNIEGPYVHDWPRMVAARDKEMDRLEGVYRGLLDSAGVVVFQGRAELDGPNRILVDDQIITAKTILIATGAAPVRPDIPGAKFMATSDDIFNLRKSPSRVAIIGGGYIACEFSGIFSGLGAQVVQLHRGEQILRGFDDELRDHLADQISRRGVDLRCSIQVSAVERTHDVLSVYLSDGSTLEVDTLMIATGRQCATSRLGLDTVGVEVDDIGAIKVDQFSRTTNPGIYAVGDVTNRVNLTPVAVQEGHAFADTVFGGRPRAISHENVPNAVFSQPQAASVGLSETQAKAKYPNVKIFGSSFRPMTAALSSRDERALIKLVVDASSDRVLGAHIVAADAAEIIQGLAIAIKSGVRKADMDATLGVHPTIAEEFVTLREPR